MPTLKRKIQCKGALYIWDTVLTIFDLPLIIRFRFIRTSPHILHTRIIKSVNKIIALNKCLKRISIELQPFVC